MKLEVSANGKSPGSWSDRGAATKRTRGRTRHAVACTLPPANDWPNLCPSAIQSRRRRWVVGSVNENSVSSQVLRRRLLQRRYQPRSCRAADLRVGRGKRQTTWLEQTAVHADELRHGRGVRRYERGLWRERVPSCSGRGARTRIDARASPDPVGPVHLRCPDPFHP